MVTSAKPLDWVRVAIGSLAAMVLCANASGAQATSAGRASTPWSVEESRSAMTDEPTVILTSEATGEVRGWLDRARPALVVRCKERKLDVYLRTGMSSHVEGAHGNHTIRYRIDTTRAVSESSWEESTSNEALFAPAPAELAERLMSGNTVLFEWTPFNANPVQARFDVMGLEAHRAKLVAACPGALAPTSAAERAAYAASPEGRAAAAIAAFKAAIDANPRYRERMSVVSTLIEGALGTRTRDTYVTTNIASMDGCKLTVAVARQLPNHTTSDTSWLDLRSLALAPAARSQKPLIGWAVVLSTETGEKRIVTRHWTPRDRAPKAASYATLFIPFDKEEVATEAARLAGAAISACREVPD